MKVKKSPAWSSLNVGEKAGFIGKKSVGFSVVSENVTPMGAIELLYTYEGWDFSSAVLILPLLDTGYCQIVEVD